MQHKMKELKEKINSGQFPKDFSHFGGADLIITNDPNRNFREGTVVVYTEHAAALSWLVFELQNIFRDSDYPNSKMIDYISVGETINYGLENNWNITAIMLTVIIDCLDSSF